MKPTTFAHDSKTKCPEDATILKHFIKKDRVYDFLAGFNSEFNLVKI